MGEAPAVLRLLVSNGAAGIIIGKSGVRISDIQDASGARMQLSRSSETYPGTYERVLTITGQHHQIVRAVQLSQASLASEGVLEQEDGVEVHQIKILAPNAVVGGIIGRGGESIRAMSQQTGCSMRVSSQAQHVPGAANPERIVSISAASLDSVVRAVSAVLSQMLQDDKYTRLAVAPGVPPAGPFTGLPGPRGQNPPAAGGASSPAAVTIEVAVPDSLVGIIVGRGGSALQQLEYWTGTAIRISRRDELIPGTTNRLVSIRGSLDGAQLAQFIINQKVQAARAALQGAAGDGDHGTDGAGGSAM